MTDRRHLKRWKIEHKIEIRIEGAEEKFEACLHDLDFRGMRISAQKQLPREPFFKFTITLSPDFAITTDIWIAWRRDHAGIHIYGCYFNNITAEEKEKIYKFMFKYSPYLAHKPWTEGSSTKEEEDKMEDRRVFERWCVDYPIKFLDRASGAEGFGTAVDISAKGVGLRSPAPVPLDSELELWILIPDHGEPLYTRGQVVWSEKFGPGRHQVGIDLEKADLVGLSRLLRTR